MRYFERDGKYNWVDENNVVVGFDSQSNCCESFGFLFTSKEPTDPFVPDAYDQFDPTDNDLLSYRFDKSWFKELRNSDEYDSGGAVAFRLDSDTKPALWLVLYNSHNGYYSHGFEMAVGGQEIRSGSL